MPVRLRANIVQTLKAEHGDDVLRCQFRNRKRDTIVLFSSLQNRRNRFGYRVNLSSLALGQRGKGRKAELYEQADTFIGAFIMQNKKCAKNPLQGLDLQLAPSIFVLFLLDLAKQAIQR